MSHMTNKTYYKIFITLFVVAMIVVAGFFVVRKAEAPGGNSQPITDNLQSTTDNNENTANNNKKQQTVDPIDGAVSRITKKSFGTYVNSKNSPVSPERFTGFHNAVDLETTLEEQNIDVGVKVLCDGKLLAARTASGYGGVMVQSCTLDGQAVTVIYGHIKPSSIAAKIGDQLKAGDFLANLGDAYSNETDGERKHLHLGIHKGTGMNILGYVQSKSELSGWLDPVKYLN